MTVDLNDPKTKEPLKKKLLRYISGYIQQLIVYLTYSITQLGGKNRYPDPAKSLPG